MSKCVFFCIHEPVMLKNVEALKKVFGLDVVSFFLWQYAEQEAGLSVDEKRKLGPFYSFPQYYLENIERVRSLAEAELNKAQWALEKQLGIFFNPMLVTYDPYLSRISDYRTSRNLQVLNLEFAAMLLERHEPSFFLGGRESYLRNIVAEACRRRGAPTITTARVRSAPYRVGGIDVLGQQLGMREAFDKLEGGASPSADEEETVRKADARYESFLQQQSPPSYAVRNALSTTRSIKALFTSTPLNLVKNSLRYYRNRYDREALITENPFHTACRWPSKMARMYYLERSDYLQRRPDLSAEYIYLPLHMTPEVSDLFYGEKYSQHLGFVKSLAKKIPSGYRLYVKEHTSMLGRRPFAFYEELKQWYNIEVVHPSVSTFDLIKNCRAVATVTGTAGWEGYLLNKPVVVFGRVFYNFLPGVLRADLYAADFALKLQRYLAEFGEDTRERRNAMRAYFLSSAEMGSQGLADFDKVRGEEDSLMWHTRYVRSLFEKWGTYLVENDPNTILEKDVLGGEICE